MVYLRHFVLCVFIVSICEGSVIQLEDRDNDIQQILRDWNGNSKSKFAQDESAPWGTSMVNGESKSKLAVNSFSWKSCGSSSDWADVKTLSIGPDPLLIPGNVTISFSGSLSHDVDAPLELSLDIEKKVLFWVPIPCIDQLGSCDYEDICSIVKTIQCPPAFQKHGIPCLCPVKAGSYSLPSSTIEVNPFGIPSWLEGGDYKVTATIRQNGQEVMCIFVQFSLTSGNQLV